MPTSRIDVPDGMWLGISARREVTRRAALDWFRKVYSSGCHSFAGMLDVRSSLSCDMRKITEKEMVVCKNMSIVVRTYRGSRRKYTNGTNTIDYALQPLHAAIWIVDQSYQRDAHGYRNSDLFLFQLLSIRSKLKKIRGLHSLSS